MAAMLAPETLIFEPKQMTEKKGKLSFAKSCISDKGFFSFHPNDHHEPVVIQNMKIVVLTPSGLDEASNQLRLSLTNDTEYYKVTGIKSIASLLFSRDFFKTFLLQGTKFVLRIYIFRVILYVVELTFFSNDEKYFRIHRCFLSIF